MANVFTPIDSSFKLVFDDEFNGTVVNTSKWGVDSGTTMNNVVTSASNVTEANGNLTLTLASANSGAEVQTPDNTGFRVAVGAYVEARVYFSGNGSQLYDWPAFWISGPNWPAAGENDIAEVLGGQLTVNYHSPSGSHNQGAVPGYWGDNFHVYGLVRNASSVDVYWDGNLVKSYPTDDNGVGEQIIFNIGNGQGSPVATGAASQMHVDYVHVYSNASSAIAVTPDAGYGGPGDTGGGTPPPPPPPPDTVSLSLLMSATRTQSAPTFIAKVDGQQVLGPSKVTASDPNTQLFSFSDALAAGQHVLEIDYTQAKGKAGTMFVDQATAGGTSLLTSPDRLQVGGHLDLSFTV